MTRYLLGPAVATCPLALLKNVRERQSQPYIVSLQTAPQLSFQFGGVDSAAAAVGADGCQPVNSADGLVHDIGRNSVMSNMNYSAAFQQALQQTAAVQCGSLEQFVAVADLGRLVSCAAIRGIYKPEACEDGSGANSAHTADASSVADAAACGKLVRVVSGMRPMHATGAANHILHC